MRLSEKLVRISDPVCYVPNMAIHLQTAEELKAFRVNPVRAHVLDFARLA